ncbi:hypothetical protein EYF80_025290 [Liparis tanakae]|uniref:Uncharacterized protein n=1 Tax=Liparis tanakae TaxID=230148 RepID=A0A4Z2HI70_9TELE|nr:hypothetical protein EYF80_025290 [Liparis tanakae]
MEDPSSSGVDAIDGVSGTVSGVPGTLTPPHPYPLRRGPRTPAAPPGDLPRRSGPSFSAPLRLGHHLLIVFLQDQLVALPSSFTAVPILGVAGEMTPDRAWIWKCFDQGVQISLPPPPPPPPPCKFWGDQARFSTSCTITPMPSNTWWMGASHMKAAVVTSLFFSSTWLSATSTLTCVQPSWPMAAAVSAVLGYLWGGGGERERDRERQRESESGAA